MCDDFTLSEESRFGSAFLLCVDAGQHLLVQIDEGLNDAQEREEGAARRVLAAFAPPATVLVVENDYFDLDARSEGSVTHGTSFAAGEDEVLRLHFFAVPDAPQLLAGTRLRDLVADNADHYLGYATVRPLNQIVGRSIVTTRGRHPDLREPGSLGRHVRTTVEEQITLFGVPLTAVGVPFLEQDGALLRCAQVSSWVCHYSAVLRGDAARRPTAEFHLAEDPTGSYGRAYPSQGLTALGVSRILQSMGLPPEVVDVTTLSRTQQPHWYHRPNLRQAHLKAGGDEDELQRLWQAENLTTAVCRYLNSGIPSIVCRGAQRHSQVICGYVREAEVSEERRVALAGSVMETAGFLTQDDWNGPFTYLPVHDLQAEFRTTAPYLTSVLVPLPVGLWLPGDQAEDAAAEVFRDSLRERLNRLDGWAALNDLPDVDLHRATLESLVAATDDDASGTLALRAYAATGNDFKVGLAQRGADPALQRAAGYTPLPKYVWVAEVVDRELRRQHQRSVGLPTFAG